jgi:hypothetical protein
LTFIESGVYSLLFLLLLLSLGFKSALNDNRGYKNIIFISLTQVILLGSMDHYFFTIHQTHLLFWLILGLSFSES